MLVIRDVPEAPTLVPAVRKGPRASRRDRSDCSVLQRLDSVGVAANGAPRCKLSWQTLTIRANVAGSRSDASRPHFESARDVARGLSRSKRASCLPPAHTRHPAYRSPAGKTESWVYIVDGDGPKGGLIRLEAVLDPIAPHFVLFHLQFWTPWPVLGAAAGVWRRRKPAGWMARPADAPVSGRDVLIGDDAAGENGRSHRHVGGRLGELGLVVGLAGHAGVDRSEQ
jgi:hypothetical protein